jgi:hypothetical protein
MENFESDAFRQGIFAVTIIALRTDWLIVMNGIDTIVGVVIVRISDCSSDAVH